MLSIIKSYLLLLEKVAFCFDPVQKRVSAGCGPNASFSNPSSPLSLSLSPPETWWHRPHRCLSTPRTPPRHLRLHLAVDIVATTAVAETKTRRMTKMPSRSEKRSVVPTPNGAADNATATRRRILTLPPLLPIPEVKVLRIVSLKHLVSQRSARRVTDIRRARKGTRARVIAINIIGNSKSWGLWHGAGYLLACLDNVSGLCFFLAMGAIYRNRRMREVAALFSFQSYWGVTKMEFVAVLSLEKRFY